MATRVDVKDLRARLGLSRSEFGKQFPVSSRTVRRWENGEVDPSQMAMKRLSDLSAEPVPSGPKRREAVLT